MGTTDTPRDHSLFSTEEYRSKDRDLVRAEEVRQAADEEVEIWRAHRIAERAQGKLFDGELPATA